MEVINNRRSIRSFTDETVSDENIEKILRAAMQAPSAGNQQPWEFIVIKDKKRLLGLTAISPYAKPIGKASFCIAVLGNKKIAAFPENIYADLGASCQNMLLEATSLNIGSLWTSVAPLKDREEFLKEYLNLKDEHIPYALLAFGYPSSEDAFKYIDRYKRDRVFLDSYTKE